MFLLRTGSAAVSLATALGIAAAVTVLVVEVLGSGPIGYTVGGWEAPLGIELYADGLSAVMLIMAAVVGTAITVYATGYFSGSPAKARYFWPLFLFLWSAMNIVFLSADIFNLYVGLELIGLSAVALLTLEGGRNALTAGMRYLLVSLLGSLIYLLGVALLYGTFGTLAVAELGAQMFPAPSTWLALGLITVGMMLKTALFPLHFWLPPAHSSAPSPVSALLSALVIKGSFYLLLRLWFDVFPEALTPAAGQLLGALGATAILWGSVLALFQRRLKLLVAYSTVAQIGYLFILFPLASAEAWSGGVYHALSHACAKAAMFMAAGTLLHVLGTDDLDSLDGASERFPVSVYAFGLAGITLMGLPFSGGFTAKWLLLSAALEDGQWWYAVVVLAGGLLAAGYLLRALRPMLTPAPAVKVVRSPKRSMESTALILASVALLLGLVSAPLLELVGVGAPLGGITP
ncbi:MAG: complex I subunit 5 family protein [Rubrobacteraceae bacterium]